MRWCWVPTGAAASASGGGEVAAGKALVLGQGSCPAEVPAHGYLVVCKGEKAFTFDAAGAARGVCTAEERARVYSVQ